MKGEEQRKPHVTTGNVLDDLGLDPQTALELKHKTEIYLGILKLIKRQKYAPRELENILGLQQPRVSELLRGKLNLLSVSKLLLYAYQLGGHTRVTVRPRSHSRAA